MCIFSILILVFFDFIRGNLHLFVQILNLSFQKDSLEFKPFNLDEYGGYWVFEGFIFKVTKSELKKMFPAVSSTKVKITFVLCL